MTTLTCWRCSSKSRILFFPPIPFYHSASFTTSASASAYASPSASARAQNSQKHAAIARKALAKGAVQKGVKAAPTKKKPAIQRHRKTAIGERLALRKRIVLSNNNAVVVAGVPEFGVESIGDEQLHGHVVALTVSLVGQLRAVDAFKRTQNWGLFRNPAMLVRRETVEYGRLFKEMSEQLENRRTIRRILVGERGSGKSMMLLQAMTMAFLKGWIVINLPEAQDIVIAHTEYGPIPGTSPPLYQQKVYTASLLAAIVRANPILSTLTLQVPPPTTPIPIEPSITLNEFALLGAADPEIAYDVFKTLVQDLLLPSRPPLLLCIDGLAHTMKPSAYRNPAFALIHAHDLAILKWFMGHLSGASELPNGGMVLAAMSASNTSPNLSLDTALYELESLQSQTAGLDRKPEDRKLPNADPSLTTSLDTVPQESESSSQPQSASPAQETRDKDTPVSNPSPNPSLDTSPQEPESLQPQSTSPAQETEEKATPVSNLSATPSSLATPFPQQPQPQSQQPTPPKPLPLPLYQETSNRTFTYHPGRHNPYLTYDQRVLDIFLSRPGIIQVQRLKGLSKTEARALMEYWAKSGVVRQTVDETLLSEKWALSGGGVVGELERASFGMII